MSQSTVVTLSLPPDSVPYSQVLFARARDQRVAGNYAAALSLFDEVLQMEAGLAEAENGRAMCLRRLGRPHEALASYNRALALKPDFVDAYMNRGNVLCDLGRFAEALASYDQALRLRPPSAELLSNRGNALHRLNRFNEALACYDESLKLNGSLAGTLNNRGNALQSMHRYAEALECYQQALHIDPAHVDAISNRGLALFNLRRPVEALANMEAALALNPAHGDANWNKGLCHLQMGDFARGWKAYEWRWRTGNREKNMRNFSQPLWLGERSLQGKTILLHAEQGLGDTLQCCRYAAMAAAQGATVVLEVQPALAPLLKGLEGVTTLIAKGAPLPHFDLHCPLLSLPLAFGTTLDNIPARLPYLHAEPALTAQFSARLETMSSQLPLASRGLRIGLAWSGNTTHANDTNRSLPLAGLKPLARDGVLLVSLQKEVRASDLPTLQALEATGNMVHFGSSLKHFADTAALLSLMDLVITVDTSVAHLAGAMGKPVWMMLPGNPDFRWLLERSDSPWYPSMRIFRQTVLGNWGDVLDEISAALDERLVPNLLETGLGLLRQGKPDQAEAYLARILQSEPEHFDALHLSGVVALQLGKIDAGISLIRGALNIRPEVASAWSNCGNGLRMQQKPSEALECYDRAIGLQPDFAEALGNRASVLTDLKRYDEALEGFERALCCKPDHLAALVDQGLLLSRLGRHEDALCAVDRALALMPGDPNILCNHGVVLSALGRFDEALASLERALTIDPVFALATYYRGGAQYALWRYDEALASFDRVIAIDPGFTDAWINRSAALRMLGRHDQALHSIAEALRLQPGDPAVLWLQSTCKLRLGDLAEGFRDYEARWEIPRQQPFRRKFIQPLWLGDEPLQGRTILLLAEQGLGDMIQFVRYARMAAARGATVVLEVAPALVPLLEGMEGVSQVVAAGSALPHFDCYCPLLSLPLAFKTTLDTIPADMPYLHADAALVAQWQGRLAAHPVAPGLQRIGLAWSGSVTHGDDYFRSLGLDRMQPLLGRPAHYVSLQKDVRAADLPLLASRSDLLDPSALLTDFSQTAALVASMDLVITVDTSVAHLAGAMGKPVWLLLPFCPDWRWLLERSDSPWYPSMRLFRQDRAGDWDSVLAEVSRALDKFIADPLVGAGLAHYGQGRLNEASDCFGQVLKFAPGHFDALHLSGVIALQRGQVDAGVDMIRRALDIRPEVASAWSNYGNGLKMQKRLVEALACFERATELKPDFADALNNHANSLMELHRNEEALASYEKALACKPEFADALSNQSKLLGKLGRHAEALDAIDKALALNPDEADTLGSRAMALCSLQRCEESLASYDRAIALKPELVEAWSNRSVVLGMLGRHEEALASTERALALEPGNSQALWNASICKLRMGRFAEGFREYEARWQTDQMIASRRNFVQPLWLGEQDIRGKTVLLQVEQGLGDTLQFARYAKLVAARGAAVLLEVPPPLRSLLEGTAGASQVISAGERLPHFDYYCPLLSLPLACGTTLESIPADIPYVRSDPALSVAWKTRLEQQPGASGQPRIGLVWSGSVGHLNDHYRSLPFERIQPLLDRPAQFVSLQKEIRPADRPAVNAQTGLLQLGDSLATFSDTAAVVDSMDLIITVDTSVAHLAGAMGKPVWLLLPFCPDWRWLLERSDSPWYPSMRLFRQDRLGDWQGMLATVEAALDNFLVRDDVAAAMELLQQGRLAEADQRCQAILEQQPRNAGAMHLSGLAAFQQGQADTGIKRLRKAIEIDAANAPMHSNLGNMLKMQNQADEALVSYERALALSPDFSEALANRANLLFALQRFPEALAGYEDALRAQPESIEALANRGLVLAKMERFEDAEVSVAQVLARQPGHVGALTTRANILRDLRKFDAALACYDQILTTSPNHAEALLNSALMLQELKRFEEALERFGRTLQLQPDDFGALISMGNILLMFNRHTEALEHYARAVALQPEHPGALNNYGNCLGYLGRPHEALDIYVKALQQHPGHSEMLWNESLCRLQLGDLAQGFRLAEARWETTQMQKSKRNFSQPLWLGDHDIAGKTILLHAEQGLGDTIQFCRYVKLVAALGAHIVLEVQPSLAPLISGLEGGARLIRRGDVLPEFDFHCPLMSLPLALRTSLDTIPSAPAYLHSDPDKLRHWSERLGPAGEAFRIGLVWSGNASHINDHNRSLSLASLATLFSLPAQFFSLQKEVRASDLPQLEEWSKQGKMQAIGAQFENFADTAAVADLMDLIITVDTSVAHLAGALGKPVWLLMSFVCDWRWLLGRDDSPWYPSMRLFRQSASGDWSGVIAAVSKALAERIATARKAT